MITHVPMTNDNPNLPSSITMCNIDEPLIAVLIVSDVSPIFIELHLTLITHISNGPDVNLRAYKVRAISMDHPPPHD